MSVPRVFDRTLLRQRKKRIAARFDDYNFLHRHALQLLIDRLSDICRTFPVTILCGAPLPSQDIEVLRQVAEVKFFAQMDLVSSSGQTQELSVVGDEEWFPFSAGTLDLVIANLDLHQTNDLPGVLIQMRRALKPDGLFLATMFGGETLWQLRECLGEAEEQLTGGRSPRLHPFADKQQMGSLMQRAGFALPVVDSEHITVTYETIHKLLHDLRYMGEGNILNNRSNLFINKDFFNFTQHVYKAQYADPEGRLEAHFEMIFLQGWAPHESQQKPLKPGSAAIRLADALQTSETGLGEDAS